MVSVRNVVIIVKQILEEWIVRESGILSKTQCETLLRSEETITTLPTKRGNYPRYPLYEDISKKLHQWLSTGNFL